MLTNSFVVENINEPLRIDRYLVKVFEDFTRNRIQKLIEEGHVIVNDKVVKANFKIKNGDNINVTIPDAVEPDISPENLNLDIVFEDEDIIVVNKPKGMVVHPAPGHYSGTLVNGLMFQCKEQLSGINGVLRPGIVHRIDMDTTGLIVACKNDYAHNFIAEQLKNHSSTRKYQAICYNSVKDDEGSINGPIGRHPNERKKMSINYKDGKEAITHYKVINRLGNFTHVECQLETGRTHQIRVHMASINNPLLGDEVYGPKNCHYNLQGQTLHAGVLGFIHPRTKEYIQFEVEVPKYFKKLLDILKSK